MESPEPTSAKLKLWRWLLLLSMISSRVGRMFLMEVAERAAAIRRADLVELFGGMRE